MTIRERLADWISGGELSYYRTLAELQCEKRGEDRFARGLAELDASIAMENMQKACDQMQEIAAALRRISAMETPSANATVRRMARIARDALK